MHVSSGKASEGLIGVKLAPKILFEKKIHFYLLLTSCPRLTASREPPSEATKSLEMQLSPGLKISTDDTVRVLAVNLGPEKMNQNFQIPRKTTQISP